MSELKQIITRFEASETEIDRLVMSELFRQEIEKVSVPSFLSMKCVFMGAH